MNLLQLIIIFIALIVCGAIGYIAWELTSERRDDVNDAAARRPADAQARQSSDEPQ